MGRYFHFSLFKYKNLGHIWGLIQSLYAILVHVYSMMLV